MVNTKKEKHTVLGKGIDELFEPLMATNNIVAIWQNRKSGQFWIFSSLVMFKIKRNDTRRKYPAGGKSVQKTDPGACGEIF